MRSDQYSHKISTTVNTHFVYHAFYCGRKSNSDWLKQQRGQVGLDNRGVQRRKDLTVKSVGAIMDPVTRSFPILFNNVSFILNLVAKWLHLLLGCWFFFPHNVIIINTYPTLRNRTWNL